MDRQLGVEVIIICKHCLRDIKTGVAIRIEIIEYQHDLFEMTGRR